MQQYSIFPKELVGFTELARRKALDAGWNGVAQRMFEKGRLKPQVRLRGAMSNPKTPILS